MKAWVEKWTYSDTINFYTKHELLTKEIIAEFSSKKAANEYLHKMWDDYKAQNVKCALSFDSFRKPVGISTITVDNIQYKLTTEICF